MDSRVFPTPFDAYPPASADGLWATLVDRATLDPFNVIATAIFALAVLHTFGAARVLALAHRVQLRFDERLRRDGLTTRPSVAAEVLHFFGEVEVVFGLWAVVLLGAMTLFGGWQSARHYLNDTVLYTEPLFVVVIMALAASRPIVAASEAGLRRVAALGGGTPAAWWLSILIIGPLLGSFITEPAAMTISALLLARQFFDLSPSNRLKYATLGLLFVNVSIGGTLTHFAAPPVLMVARPWGWDTAFMLSQFGWRSAVAIVVATLGYYAVFRTEFSALAARRPVEDLEVAEDEGGTLMLPIPPWVTATHAGFMVWTVLTTHYPVLFISGFLFFLGFVKATSPYQARIDLRAPLLVGFFLAGLVVHGGLQGWWMAPVLGGLSDEALFGAATVLTAFTDNALITYLATLAPNLGEGLKIAVVQGAVAGGGLTVIANAPNPAGQALLARYFGGSIKPLGLARGALMPTVVAVVVFRMIG